MRQMMLREGWLATKEEACGFAPPVAAPVAAPVVESVVESVVAVEEDKPPTRDELEQMAKDLEIKFDGRTSDKKLLALIGEKVEGDNGLD
jgi:hypothetical protein